MYQITVERTQRVLAARAVVAQSLLARLVGLIGRSRLEPGEALIIPSCQSIHTGFMRFPIDAVFVDRQWRVVAIQPRMAPWRISPFVWKAWGVVELAGGTLDRVSVKVGDHLVREPLPARTTLDNPPRAQVH